MFNMSRVFAIATCAALLSVGITLLVVSWPRLAAFTIALPGDPVMMDIRRRKDVSPEAVDTLIETYSSALEWYPRGRTLSDLGLAHMVRAELSGNGISNMGELLIAERYVLESLNRAPMNPYAWVRLSVLWSQLFVPPKFVVGALMNSVHFARVSETLWLPRVQLFLAYWPQLDEAARGAAINELSYVYGKYPRWVDRTIKNYGRESIRHEFGLEFLTVVPTK